MIRTMPPPTGMFPPLAFLVLFFFFFSFSLSTFTAGQPTEQHGIWLDTAIGKHFARRYTLYDRDVYAFYGVRYAERPADGSRFAAPSNRHGQGIHRHDLFHTPTCPQRNFDPALEKMKVVVPAQEDCLYLNIWMPAKREDSFFYPVVVVVHGGDFHWGSSTVESLNGTILAARVGAVVVSMQYRLGALGFLHTGGRGGGGGGSDFAPGNAGLADQALALEWIRKNVRHFSGDQDKITVIGHGSGASSLGYHLLSKETSQLFQRAILLSGVPNSETAFVQPQEAERRARVLVSRLHRSESSHHQSPRDREVLKTASWGDIVVAQSEVTERDGNGDMLQHFGFLKVPFVPTVDGSLITDHPLRMLERADHLKGKEIIIGWTKDEGTILANEHVNLKTTTNDLSSDWLRRRLEMMARGDGNLTSALIRLYGAGKESNLERFIDAVGDFYFKCPANRFADGLERRGASVLRLEFNYRPSTCPQWLRVAQGCDLEILFWHANERGTDALVRKSYFKFFSEFVYSGFKNIKTPRKDDVLIISHRSGQQVDDRKSFCRGFEELIPLDTGMSGTKVTFPSAALVVITFHILIGMLGF